MSGSRLHYPPDRWRVWYGQLLADMAGLTPADVLARWVQMAAPSYQPAGLPPSSETLATAPEHLYLEREGIWWRRDDTAELIPAKPGISWDVIGPFLRLNDGELVRDRETARRHLGSLAEDPMVAALLNLFLTAARIPSARRCPRWYWGEPS